MCLIHAAWLYHGCIVRHSLVKLLGSRGIDVPDYVESAEKLNPYAAEFHEGVLVEHNAVSFETSWAVECVRKTREWAERLVQEEWRGGEVGSHER